LEITVICEKKETAGALRKKYPQLHIYDNVMPHIFREDAKETLRRMLESDEIVARTIDELGFLKENGYKGRIIADTYIYTANRAALSTVRELGVYRDTVPLELNYHEITQRGAQNSELTVYGRVPMMVSAQCLYRNTNEDRCGRDENKGKEVLLTDRMGIKMPCICFCGYCYNVIYNSVPVSLHNEMDRVNALKPAALRLCFTVEDPVEAVRIAGFFIALIQGETDKDKVPFKEFTKGHFIKAAD